MVAKSKSLKSPNVPLVVAKTTVSAAARKPQSTPATTKMTAASKPTPNSHVVLADQNLAGKVSQGAATSLQSDTSRILKVKDLIDKVVATTGAKKSDARTIIEATLTVLGEALSRGDGLNLPPLGRAKVSRATDAASGKAMTIKLRRNTGGGQGDAKAKQRLADAEE